MSDIPKDIEELSPHKLLRNFSRNRLLACFVLALALHVVVIGGLSLRYIYRAWINPATPAARAETADGNETPAAGPSDGVPDSAGGDGSTAASGNATPTKTPGEDGAPSATDAPVVDRVTEEAEPEEIPQEPGGLGISIDDIEE